MFVCDAPARAYVKCITGHSSYHGYERCTQKEKNIGRITFPQINDPLRIDESFAVDQKHHRDISPLTNISILVSQFSFDYMHLVWLVLCFY